MRSGWFWLAIGVLACGCSGDDDADGQLGAAGVGVNVGDAGGAGSTAGSSASAGRTGSNSGSGSGGTQGSQSGASGRSGNGSSGNGSGGSGTAGTSSEPNPTCDPQCEAGQECVLVPVQCFRAPCPAQPMCMPAPSGSGQACGSRGLPACPDGQYCQYAPSANCGAADQGGRCMERQTICTREYRPVCGCDGKTYGNACEAGAAGTSVASEGACDERAAADCDLRKVTCDAPQPTCADGMTVSVNRACYGSCVPIESCACAGPDECPDRDHYTCHLSAGHCGPYV